MLILFIIIMKHLLGDFKNKNLLKFLLVSHILILLTVYFIEYILNIYACALCKYQRIPYFFNLLILSLLIINFKKFKKAAYILIFFILINLSISFYHIGVEQKIFSETKVCLTKEKAINKEELLKQLSSNGIKGCSEVTFRIFGLSLSTLNFITNIVFFLISIHIIRNEKK